MSAPLARPSAAACRRLWLVRHGETTGESSIRYHGSNDVPLSELGRAQIAALAPWLHGAEFVRVVHSPLQRAAESAAILGEHLQLPRDRFTADERLREISFGACEGLTREEIDAAFPDFWRAHGAGEIDAFPQGEARSAFAARVAAAFDELLAQPWQGDLLVVAHRGIVRQGLCSLLCLPGTGPDPFGVPLGSLSVARDDGGWQLELLGAVP